MEKIHSKLRRTDYYDFGHWDDFPVTQQWFATGECMAHLDHLRYSGNIDRRLCKNTYRYFENYDTAIMR